MHTPDEAPNVPTMTHTPDQPTTIVVTDEVAERIWYAVAREMHEATEFIDRPLVVGSPPWNDLRGGRSGDDPGDYWFSRIDIMANVFAMRWDEDPKADLTVWLNTPYDPNCGEVTLPSGRVVTPLGQYARDGVADYLVALNPPAFDHSL